MTRLITTLFFAMALASPALGATLCYESTPEQDATLAWHAKQNKAADAQDYFTQAVNSAFGSWVKIYDAQREAVMIQAARDCLAAGKRYSASVDRLGVAQGVCE